MLAVQLLLSLCLAGERQESRDYSIAAFLQVQSLELRIDLQHDFARSADDVNQVIPSDLSDPGPFMAMILQSLAQQQDPQATCEFRSPNLARLTGGKAAHAWMARSLVALEQRVRDQVLEISGHAGQVEESTFEELLKGHPALEESRSGRGETFVRHDLTEEQVQRIIAALDDSEETSTHLPRVCVAPMQPWNITAQSKFRYVESYQQTTVFNGQSMALPVLGVINEGFAFRGRGIVVGEADDIHTLGFQVIVESGLVHRPVYEHETELGTIHVPRATAHALNTTILMDSGGYVLFYSPHSIVGTREVRNLVVLRAEPRRLTDPRQHLPASASAIGLEVFGSEVPKINTQVIAIDGQHVTLGVGTADGVQPGYAFDVYRGASYVGRVRVTHVDSGSSLARIEVRGPSEYRVRDNATTRL